MSPLPYRTFYDDRKIKIALCRQDPFAKCDLTVDIAEAEATCYEMICPCATATEDFDKDCRCNILHQFATMCLSSQPGVDLSAWRLKYECREYKMLASPSQVLEKNLLRSQYSQP